MKVLSGKYRFTGKTIKAFGRVYHQIIATRDINKYVHKYTIGGYIEKSENLCDDGMCWVDSDSVVGGNVHISGDAEICNSIVIADGKELIRVEGNTVITNTEFLEQGNVLITDSVLTSCYIEGETVIMKSVIERSDIKMSCIADCFIADSDITDAVIYNRSFHNGIED